VGRPSKSIEEHKANGTYRPSRHGVLAGFVELEPEPAEALARPEKLDGEAAKVWDELVELLGDSVRKVDTPVLVELSRWIARSDKIAAQLDPLDAADKQFKSLLIAAGIATDKVSTLTKLLADRKKLKTESAQPAPAKVPTRPKTKLDQMGAPKGRTE
jgi:hypothetical protein